MKTAYFWVGVAVWLCGSTIATAQDALLDLIPPKAGAAIAVRNVKELKKKGDDFFKAAGIKAGLRPSQVFDEGYKYLRIQGAVDETVPAALVLVAPSAVGKKRKIELNDLFLLTVAAIPFKDRDTIAGRFGFKKGELKPGKLVSSKRQNNDFGRYLYVRGNHLFLGNHAKAVKLVAGGKTLSTELTPGQRKRYNKADLLVHVGADFWQMIFKDFARREFNRLAERGADKNAKQITSMFISSIEDLRFMTGAVRIGKGFSLSVLTAFDKNNKAAKKLFALLRSNKQSCSLQGLPQGDVLVAQASKGNGDATHFMARAVFDLLLQNFLQTKKIISAAERPLFVGVFNEVWQHLRGTRAAMYLNRNQQQHGLFSFVAILDTNDGEKFMQQIRSLTTIADGSGLKLNPKNPKKKTADIAKLISQLGHKSFRVRELAVLKLRLVGEPALPYLQKAIHSDDLETSIRATKLHKEIAALVSQRRKDLVSQDHFRRIRPSFALIPKAEKRAGHDVDVLRIKLLKEDEDSRQPLEHLLGGEWHNMRVAVHGKQVVVLLGSEIELFEQTLKNLDQKKPGLAGAKYLQRFYKQSNDRRRFEAHVALARLLQVIDPSAGPVQGGKNSAMSSIGVSVESNQLQFDLWVPIPEVRVIAHKSGW